MAPDADKLRMRPNVATIDKDDVVDNDPATQERISTMKGLKNNEICIDGIIYDITKFDHPGGETLKVFCGNDCTVQYKMIHPYHTSKHLEKLDRVGKVADYECEYEFDTEFERDIKKEVFKIVRRGKEFATPGYIFRCAFYVCLFFFLQYLWVMKGSSFTLAIIYGMSQAFIGLNVQHDANHGAISKNSFWNDVLGLGADFIGGSKWLWIEQHWTHHSYTNHQQKDPDGKGAEPVVLFNDYPLDHPKRSFVHNFQAFYYLFVLAGYWLSSVFNPEIITLKQDGATKSGMKFESDFVVSRRPAAVFLRLLYIATNVVVPFFYHDPLLAIAHILVLSVSESLTLAIPFSLSHNFENSDRNPTSEYDKTGKKVCWFTKQVETSCTYGGFISGCVTGGLNFQVEHHLFPRMSSAWYPYIAPTVREVCKKHGVNYAYYPWIFQNMISTWKYMYQAGTGSNWAKLDNPYTGKA